MGGIPSCLQTLEVPECFQIVCLELEEGRSESSFENHGRTEEVQNLYPSSTPVRDTRKPKWKKGRTGVEEERYLKVYILRTIS